MANMSFKNRFTIFRAASMLFLVKRFLKVRRDTLKVIRKRELSRDVWTLSADMWFTTKLHNSYFFEEVIKKIHTQLAARRMREMK